MALLYGSYQLKEYHHKTLAAIDKAVEHGWGEIRILVNTIKGGKTKIIIYAGKSWGYIEDKEISSILDRKDII